MWLRKFGFIMSNKPPDTEVDWINGVETVTDCLPYLKQMHVYSCGRRISRVKVAPVPHCDSKRFQDEIHILEVTYGAGEDL